jgi:hypothetical protein
MRPAKNPGLSAVQKALYLAISGAGITVFDAVSENQAFPYVTIGETSTLDDSDKTKHADEHTETIHVWSRAAGFKECKDLISSVLVAVSAINGTTDGYQIRYLDTDQVLTMRDPDGITRHGVIRTRLKVTQE